MAISFIMNKTTISVLIACRRAKHTDVRYSHLDHGKTRYFMTYPQVVNLLMEKYATDEVIVETESNSTHLAQPQNMTPSQHAKELLTRTLPCRDLCKEYALNEIIQ